MYNIKTSVIMKNLINFSKFAITALITSSLFVACSEEISENTVDTKYIANTGSIKNAGQAVDLGLPSGTKWANMNVGATSETDNGILFIWGDVTGTQVMANNDATYTDVTDPTSVSDLFSKYKGSEQTGTVCDTTNIVTTSQSRLIDLSGVSDDDKKDKIVSFMEDKLDELKSSYTGLLEATLINDDFEVVIDWTGSKFDETRLPEDDAAFKAFDYEKVTTLVISEIVSTEVSFYDSPLANNYAEIKDQFDKVRRKDFVGGDIGNAPKDRLDEKKKDNLTFVPVYSIVSDTKHDPATANWGNSWRMPTTIEFVELLEKCEWEFVGSGYKVTGPNGNSIFFPAAGYRYGDKLFGNGNSGYYATGEITGTYHFPSMADQINGSEGAINGNENMPNMLIFQHGQYDSLDIYNNLSTSFGVSIRPVAK